jgi:hypothetical protein
MDHMRRVRLINALIDNIPNISSLSLMLRKRRQDNSATNKKAASEEAAFSTTEA